MGCVLVDLGFLSDIDTAKFEGFNEREIEFLINANKDVNTLNLRKKLGKFKCYIFEPTLYIGDQNEIKKLKRYFLKNTNSDFIVPYDEFEKFKIPESEPEKISDKKPNLAFFSPIPNEKTGVSLYSKELLDELGEYYEITVFVENAANVDAELKQIYDIKEAKAFLEDPHKFERIIYQMGGSHYHLYMYEILKKFEGVLVFHDFYMSQLIYTQDAYYHSIFYDELYYSHGYEALSFFKENGLEKTVLKYPANKALIDASLGVIAHSNEPQRIFDELCGGENGIFEVIPLLRKPAQILPKNECKNRLNLPADKLVVCTFGYVGSTKLTFDIVKAFKQTLANAKNEAILVIVGDSTSMEYISLIKRYIKEHDLQERVKITGWTNDDSYKEYLNACDIAVQLRADSRGETSAAVLDCFNYALPVIVNKHGSMRDLPQDCVRFVEDKFSSQELSTAIDELCGDMFLREKIAKNAKDHLDKFHNPKFCAEKYFKFIEKIYAKKPLLREILPDFKESKSDIISLSKSIASLKPPLLKKNKIFVDITEIYVKDIKTGIQRVVRAQLLQLLQMRNLAYQIEPIYYDDLRSTYFCAKDFMRDLYGLKEWNAVNEAADMSEGDIFYGLDYMPIGAVNAYKNGVYQRLRAKGVKLFFVIYDLIPILYPQFVPSVSPGNHDRWAKAVISVAGGLVCISDAVVDDVKEYIAKNDLLIPPIIKSMKLGCDIKATAPSYGLDKASLEILDKIRSKPTFIMVGTLEPRKGHDAAVGAFETLWRKGLDINLVIAGKIGWMVDELYEKIKKHEENGKRLIYLNFVSDELLDEIYKNSSCLIAASRAEGFGLPLVEAAIHKIPIIARELNVFKEVSNGSATFFKDDDDLAGVIEKWLGDFKEGKHIKSDLIELVSWRQSTEQAYQILTGEL